MRRISWLVVSTVLVGSGCGNDGDDIDASAFRSRADAVFCTDLVSARDTIISGVIDADGLVTPDGVATFAAGYEPILREHVVALQSLPYPDAEDDHVAAAADAATAVARRLRAIAADPTTATASSADDLRAMATSPELVERLTVAGLRTC